MKIRIELAKPRAPSWPFVLRLLKKIPSHKTETADGLEIHSAEFSLDEVESFVAIWNQVMAWKQKALYFDGELVPNWEGNRLWSVAIVRREGKHERRRMVEDLLADVRRRNSAE